MRLAWNIKRRATARANLRLAFASVVTSNVSGALMRRAIGNQYCAIFSSVRNTYRRVLTVLAVVLALTTALTLPAETQAQAPKIGYVNAVKLIESAPQGEMALKTLEAEFSPREQELREIRDRVRDLEDQLEKDSLVMKDSERRDRENEIRELQRDQKRSRQEMREDYNLRRNEELADLQRVVTKAIVEIAKAENYDLILQDSVYVSPKLDITEKVLEKLRNAAQ